MLVRIILCVAITLLIVCSTCESLRGDSSAVCKRTVSRKETRYVPYLETYRQKVFGIAFRIRSRTNYKAELHTLYTTEAVCCEGYQSAGGTCEPFCSEPCTNGKCVKPNLCECDRGYALDFFGQRCDPVCAIPCVYGQCAAPETCACDDGYQLTANKYSCAPACSSTCENGYCADPNVCGCNPGYERNNDNECDPICDRPCVNGKCVAPDTCTCDDGFKRSQDDVFTCEPRCTQPCVFGRCTAPDTCTCDEGYEFSTGSNFTCDPVCNETCIFGTCIVPDTCSCNEGYALTPESKYVCKPICEDECDHGNCVGPNICECHDGYVNPMGEASNGTTCKPHCNDSCTNGVCAVPNTCTCNLGFRFNSTTTDCDPVCSKPCVNGFCQSPETCECLEGYVKSSTIPNTCEAVCENCINGFCEAPGKCVCNEDFITDEMDNKTCIAPCNPECIHGACSAMGCSCDSGWEGESCGESLFCFVSKPSQEHLLEVESDTMTQSGGLNSTKNASENFRTRLDRPVCDPRCITEVNSSAIVIINKTSTNEVCYFLPVDSPCNIAVARATISRTYVSMISVIVGTSLCALVLYFVYWIRINKNQKTEINSGSRECVYRDEAEDSDPNTSCSENTLSL